MTKHGPITDEQAKQMGKDAEFVKSLGEKMPVTALALVNHVNHLINERNRLLADLGILTILSSFPK